MPEIINQQIQIDKDRIPIIVGITGHRDIRDEDREKLQEAVKKVFNELIAKYPCSPFVLLSPLAEGADRLAAAASIECGISIIAPLPMVPEEYTKDFATEYSLNEFYDLLNKAQDRFVVPAASEMTGGGSSAFDRVECYRCVGAYIASHCQILIALWDGSDSPIKGGTADTVKCRLEGTNDKDRFDRCLLGHADKGPVYHIVTPRTSNTATKDPVFTLKKYYPPTGDKEVDAAEYYGKVLADIDAYNRDLTVLLPNIADQIEVSKSYIISPENEAGLTEDLEALRDKYAAADIMAVRFQTRRRNTMMSLFVLGLCSLLFFELYAHAFSNYPQVLALYPATLGAAYLLFLRARNHRYQNKHLEYRTLAEGLRVQLFWKFAGMNDEVADHYLHRQKSELEWIIYALRNSAVSAGLSGKPEADDSGIMERYRLVLDHWVKDQNDFFRFAYDRDIARQNRQKKWSKGFLSAGILLAVVFVIFCILFSNSPALEIIHKPVIIIIILTAAIAAAFEGYAEMMAYSEQAKQYHRMSILFDDAMHRIDTLLTENDLAGVQGLIRELGKEALRENGDWLLIHRERPMKVPISG